jgi:hypothetical protein
MQGVYLKVSHGRLILHSFQFFTAVRLLGARPCTIRATDSVLKYVTNKRIGAEFRSQDFKSTKHECYHYTSLLGKEYFEFAVQIRKSVSELASVPPRIQLGRQHLLMLIGRHL